MAENWEKAKMISVKESTRSGGWQELLPSTDTVARQLQKRFTYLIKTDKPAETHYFPV